MSSIVHETKIYTTPKKLREIAKMMEADNKKALMGDDLNKYVIYLKGNEVIYIMWSQEK
jgi:hypothetical protein